MDQNLTVFFTSGSLTDWLWVLPLVITAIFLHRERFGYAGIALGIACAMKQQPWFLVPFALIWVYQTLSGRERISRRDGTAAFLTGTGAGFLFLNLPFMVWSFGDWWQGIMHPLFGDMVPDGQGFALLSSRGLLPIPGQTYTVGLAVFAVLTMWAYAHWFDRLQNLLWVLPAAFLLLSHRSFHSYFIYWVPLALLWLDLRINGATQRSSTPVAGTSDASPMTSRSVMVMALLLVAAVGTAWVLPGSSTPLNVGSVDVNIENGMVKSLAVEVTNFTDHVIEPVFEVYWRGQSVPWEASTDDVIPAGGTGQVTIVPQGPEGIPPTVQEGAGSRHTADFRVRVNESGSSVYVASDVITTPLSDRLVNPHFESWTRLDTVFSAPYGWHPAQHGGSDGQRSAAPLLDGVGASLHVTTFGAGPSDWVETSLLQDVPAFEGCFRWDFTHNVGYETDRNGSPLAVSGVQFVQGESSVWFVPSDVHAERATTLSDGTSIVEMPAEPGEPTSVTLDVVTHAAAAGLDPGARGTIKVFNAVHQTIAADSVLTVTRLEPVACS
jgi:hypothetical protein